MDEEVTASLHKHRRTTLERLEKYISDTYFTDVNLRGKLYPFKKNISKISHWRVPGGEGSWQQWSFRQMLTQSFTPIKVGESFGPTWSTHWFKIEIAIPEAWKGQPVLFRWKSQSEAMIWSRSGEPLQGLSTGIGHQMRPDFLISQSWNGSVEPHIYYIEMACNNMFGAGKNGMINPVDQERTFTLELAEVCTRDEKVYNLLMDLEVLHDMAKKLPEDHKGFEALYAGNQIINHIVKNEMRQARQIARTFFSKINGARAHTLALMGHCHIDSAWLWPYSETKRKCARSWVSTLRLMEEYPEMRFACSQAQQFAWVKEHYPSIYEKIKIQVKAGRFIPVGGTWVEMDGLLPSGESFMRQFLYGQLFFMREFGVKCKEFWLPDTFGYSSQIPQICQHFGISRFLTQKLSWSLVNKFPHHNFIWEGLDGSTVLAHFPPGDSYEMNVNVDEAVRTVKNLEDKGRVSTSAFLYGYGDGGGGPTRDMLERARRLKDVDGCPKMEHMSPDDFFRRLESEKHNLCRWVGELYLELHNGTYTSQANTKRLNRECEFALRDAELFLAITAMKGGLDRQTIYRHHDALVDAWKKVLLNQFHDVIPGSSIGTVYKDSDQLYREALTAAAKTRVACLPHIMHESAHQGSREQAVAVNTLPWQVHQIINLKEDCDEPTRKRMRVEGEMNEAAGGGHYVAVEMQGIGWSKLTPINPPAVKVWMEKDTFVLENSYIRAEINKNGQVTSLVLADQPDQDVFRTPEGSQCAGNQLMIYDDIPLYWDAWDTMEYHLETGKILNEKQSGCILSEIQVIENTPVMVRLEWKMKISEVSVLNQEISLSAVNPYLTFHTHVNWHENRKFLKVGFNTGIIAREASFDTQFGHLYRPTHMNTSWDSAKFEVCGHKWADLSEHNFGVAVLNDSKYGWTARGSMLSLSLLRSPKAPDDRCDMGKHSFKYAVMPHRGTLQSAGVPQRAYEFNTNLIVFTAKLSRDSDIKLDWFSVIGEGVMIEAVKLAEDKTGDVVVRLYEMQGGSHRIWLKATAIPPPKGVHLCNGLEESYQPLPFDARPANVGQDNKYFYIPLTFSPFKIVNVRFRYA